MSWTRQQLDEHLAQLETRVPALLQDANGFFRTFEEEVEFILGHVAGEDEDYAHEQLEAIIERSGVNG